MSLIYKITNRKSFVDLNFKLFKQWVYEIYKSAYLYIIMISIFIKFTKVMHCLLLSFNSYVILWTFLRVCWDWRPKQIQIPAKMSGLQPIRAEFQQICKSQGVSQSGREGGRDMLVYRSQTQRVWDKNTKPILMMKTKTWGKWECK